MQIVLTAGTPTRVPVRDESRPVLVNEGPGLLRFARTAAGCATGLPLPSGGGWIFDTDLADAGWSALWVLAEADTLFTFDTVG